MKTKLRLLVWSGLGVFCLGLLLPDPLVIPVRGANNKDWNHKTFWHEPWGQSGVHKGIDIFADAGRIVQSASYGIVIFKGSLGIGGRVVMVLGPGWKLHYYAHLSEFQTSLFRFVGPGGTLGLVGNSGNAKNRPSHLHYTVLSLFPRPWRWDRSAQGWKKTFILNPSELLLSR